MSPEIRERLAAYAHEAWSGWMRYLFEHSTLNTDGTVTIPAWAADRWRRQAGTRYQDLSADEQQSDRKEADRMLVLSLPGEAPVSRLAQQIRAQLDASEPRPLGGQQVGPRPDAWIMTQSTRKALRRLLGEGEAPVGWQDISTAPKDGTNILLSDGTAVSQGGWFDAAACGLDKADAHLCHEDWWSVDCIEHPALWQPMPAPAPVSSSPQETTLASPRPPTPEEP